MQNGNRGHGHVFARPDGVRARCGGPAICSECAKDLAAYHQAKLDPKATKEPAPPSRHYSEILDSFAAFRLEKVPKGFGGLGVPYDSHFLCAVYGQDMWSGNYEGRTAQEAVENAAEAHRNRLATQGILTPR